MNWKRTVVLCAFIIVSLAVVLSRFFLNIQDQHWAANSQAVETAYAKSILTKATRVDSFYGDEPYKVVMGEDKIGQPVIVWVSDKDIHTEMAAEAFTEAQVRDVMAKKGTGYEVERILPGKLGNDYVWEVFYKKEEDAGTRYFYDYYRFKDGTYLDTFRLSLQ